MTVGFINLVCYYGYSWTSNKIRQIIALYTVCSFFSLFNRKPHVTDQDFTEFNVNANHFQLLDGKSRLFLRIGA